MSFQEYPKAMHHPQHADAVWRKNEGNGKGVFEPDTVMTSAEKFPVVTVYNLAQEKQYAARGYRPTNLGKFGPSEYEAAMLESVPQGGYVFQEFPKFKYHPAEMPRIVKDKDEEKALGKGWSDTPVPAAESEDLA